MFFLRDGKFDTSLTILSKDDQNFHFISFHFKIDFLFTPLYPKGMKQINLKKKKKKKRDIKNEKDQ